MPHDTMTEETRDRFAAWGAILSILSEIPGARDRTVTELGERLLSLVMMDNYALGYGDAPEAVLKIRPGTRIPSAFAVWASVDDVTHSRLAAGTLDAVPPSASRAGPHLWITAAGGVKPTLEALLNQLVADRGASAVHFLPGFGDW